MFLCYMKTVKDVYKQYRQDLKRLYDVDESDVIATWVLTEVTGYSSAKLKAFDDAELTTDHITAMQTMLNRLKNGEPVQYVLGHTEFYGLTFKVNTSVLIPRPETEELVQWILNTVKACNLPIASVLDVGTGSGCIAISLKKHLSTSKVYAVDISAAALSVASENAALNQTEIHFIEDDVTNIQQELLLNNQFQIIVSNPPYVTPTDKTLMHTNVTHHEPHTALFVPEDDPLLFYKAITTYAISNLDDNGYLFFEINEAYGIQTIDLLQQHGFSDVELRKDFFGKDRMIKATKL